MPDTMVRINTECHKLLKEMSRTQHKPMHAILESAIEEYRRRCFLEAVNAAYGELRKDPKAWQDMLEERTELDRTIADGLPKEKRRK